MLSHPVVTRSFISKNRKLISPALLSFSAPPPRTASAPSTNHDCLISPSLRSFLQPCQALSERDQLVPEPTKHRQKARGEVGHPLPLLVRSSLYAALRSPTLIQRRTSVSRRSSADLAPLIIRPPPLPSARPSVSQRCPERPQPPSVPSRIAVPHSSALRCHPPSTEANTPRATAARGAQEAI